MQHVSKVFITYIHILCFAKGLWGYGTICMLAYLCIYYCVRLHALNETHNSLIFVFYCFKYNVNYEAYLLFRHVGMQYISVNSKVMHLVIKEFVWWLLTQNQNMKLTNVGKISTWSTVRTLNYCIHNIPIYKYPLYNSLVDNYYFS